MASGHLARSVEHDRKVAIKVLSQISAAGGTAAKWAHSGRELLFENALGHLVTVPVTEVRGFQAGTPRQFPSDRVQMLPSVAVPFYGLTPDDRRLMMVRLATAATLPGGGQMIVVDNWTTELLEKMKAH